nr:immunoglobulin light chain junction region [Macaca mulatta]MOV97103.1 immunoglobulin light chain junction region [Macaca mulatta]MOV99939.1 immunoglobulin light chain junction region [Macaca mulatta]
DYYCAARYVSGSTWQCIF